MIIQVHRVLSRHNPAITGGPAEKANEAFSNASAKWSDGRHIKDFPVQQFYARIGTQHSCLDHAIVFLNIKAMLGANQHRSKVSNYSAVVNGGAKEGRREKGEVGR